MSSSKDFSALEEEKKTQSKRFACVNKARRSFIAKYLLSGGALLASPSALFADSGSKSAQVGSPIAAEVVDLVDRLYYDRNFNGQNLKDWRNQIEKAGPLKDEESRDLARKLLSKLSDPYTTIRTPDEAAELTRRFDVTGAGLNLGNDAQGDLRIIQVPPPDSSAARAGLTKDDLVVSINGQSTQKMPGAKSLALVLENNDRVVMEIVPANSRSETKREVVLERKTISTNPVSYKLYDGDKEGQKIGYIKLTEFNEQAKPRTRDAVRDLEAAGATDLVLDLRMNGGGNMESGVDITGLFLDKPLVVYVTEGGGKREALYSNEPVLSKLPLQVWVDGGTASASEFVAAGLRDNCRAEIAGSRTYGKGLVQGVLGLSDGGILIETVYRYTTPRGEDLNEKGLVPEVRRTFTSSFLGSRFVEQDIKATKFNDHLDTKACLDRILRNTDPSSSIVLR